MADLDERVTRLEQLAERAIALLRQHPLGRLLISRLEMREEGKDA